MTQPAATCGPACSEAHTYTLSCALTALPANPWAPVADQSWSVACPQCRVPVGGACLRYDGSRSTVQHGKRWDAYDQAQAARQRADAARTTPDTPAASSDPAACGDTMPHPAHRYMRGLKVGECRGAEAQACGDATTRHVGASSVGEPATADDGLREQYAAAIRAKVDGTEGCANGHRLADAVLAVRDDERREARATNQRLNHRAQQAESGLTAVTRAVAEWKLGEHGTTYVPLRTLTAIARAVGRPVEAGRYELHYQRVERAEATIARVREVGPDLEVAATEPGLAEPAREAMRDASRRIRTALDGPQAPAAEPGPDGDTCRPLEINGDTIRVHGSRDLTDQERGYASAIVDAAKRKFAAEQAAPADRAQQRGGVDAEPEPHTGLVVKAYSDHGLQRWVFRCWGTDTCDGALSLDHYNEGSAHAAQDRHVTEAHTKQPNPKDPA